jgi:hypothetical protein
LLLRFFLLRLSIFLGLLGLFNECRPHFLCRNRSNFLNDDGNLFLRRSLFHGSCHSLGFCNGCSGFLSRHFFLQFFLRFFFRFFFRFFLRFFFRFFLRFFFKFFLRFFFRLFSEFFLWLFDFDSSFFGFSF